MIIVMQDGAHEKDINNVIAEIRRLGYKEHIIRGIEKTVIGAIGDERDKMRLKDLASMAGVENVIPILKPYKLASWEVSKEPLIVELGNGVKIGNGHFVVMAGPCSVESHEQIITTARAVKAAGATVFRGGAFKPRTSPYSFQGLEKQGLELLRAAKEDTGLLLVTEVMNELNVDLVAAYVDILQIGARNMQNYDLLKAVGKINKPVLLKRGMAARMEDLLMSAEYIMSQGNQNVILCERGIRTFETATRNTLDLNVIPVIHCNSRLPIIVDPSHGTGYWHLVSPMAKAAVAAGADGLMIEVHPNPSLAFSDGEQSLKPQKFSALMQELQPFLAGAGKHID